MNTDEPNRKFWAKRKFIRVRLSGEENGFSVALEQCLNEEECTVYNDFDYFSAVESCKAEYKKFEKPFIGKNPDYAAVAYVLWSNTGVAEGYFKRKPIFGSKAGMTRVWSWDNVFNALALCEFYPEIAMDQYMMYDACMNIGEYELADKIIKSFKNAVKKGAFYENYDPHTGKGQRCKNYCWSVSAFCL